MNRVDSRIVHAHVWSTGRGRHRTWHYEVKAGETVVLYDNTGAWEPILRASLIRVEALRHMLIAGHKLEAYQGARE